MTPNGFDIMASNVKITMTSTIQIALYAVHNSLSPTGSSDFEKKKFLSHLKHVTYQT